LSVLDRILAAIGATEDDPRLSFHQPLYTAADAIALAQHSDTPFANVKCTVWTDAAGDVIVTTVRADARVNTSHVRATLGTGKLQLADEDVLVHRLEVPRGAVAPFGYPPTVRCLIDSALATAEGILISPGANDATLAIDRDAFAVLVKEFGCQVAPIAKGLSRLGGGVVCLLEGDEAAGELE
jgi:prolyl-tRNA editing enzyme YbaK/EbsC (Cys-tRNA(Pro) deacylase)